MKKVSIVLLALCTVSTLGIENNTSEDVGWAWWHDLQSTGDFKQQIGDGEARIVGGSAAVPGQFPWQVAIIKDSVEFCGGSIISSQWVLTAGHCLVGAKTLLVVFGTLGPICDPMGCMVQITTSYVLHERYRFGKDRVSSRVVLENDIGLVRLMYPLCAWTETISAVRLPKREHESMLFVGEQATTSGWGFTSYPPKEISASLMFANLEVITNKKCETDLQGIISVLPTSICTGINKVRSTYNGDSGGALVWKDVNGTSYQIGIVSFGNGVGNPVEFPCGFARVTSYLDWISNITGIAIEA